MEDIGPISIFVVVLLEHKNKLNTRRYQNEQILFWHSDAENQVPRQ